MNKASIRRPSAEQIARVAERREDVTRYFAGKGRMMPPLPPAAVIKTMLGRALDERPGRTQETS